MACHAACWSASRSYTTTGASELFDIRVPVRDPARGRRITFADDPAAWARNLPTLHRTGYLTAVVVADAKAPGQRA